MSSELSEPIETAAAPEERSAPRQPYPGLRPFNDDEQRLFFGRDQQIREILDRLQQTYFAVVIGGSGSGKSSIVIAGVIPALRKKQLRGSGDFWLAARFTPQLHPMRSLATALAEFIEPKPGQSPDDTIADIEQTLLETNSLAGFLRRYRSRLKLEEGQAPESRESANLLIFCDQFEEIFREQNRGNPETRQLVDLIVEAFHHRDDYPQLYIIIGMRSEDLHRCAEFIDLPGVVNKASYLTRRLDEVEIASAIVEPMRLVLRLRGIKPRRFEPVDVDPWPFEVDLLRRLNKAVSSLAYNPDHLPLLQHLLSVLWRQVDAKLAAQGERLKDPAAAEAFRVTADDLAPALGFATIAEADEFARRNKLPDSWILERALDQAAEGEMPRDDRLSRITEMMFRLLALEDDQGIYSRRWTSRKEIAEVTRDMAPRRRGGIARLMHAFRLRLRGKDAEDQERPASDDEIETVIAAFTAPYPFLSVRPGREGMIDVSHEAFIRNWKTFREWLRDEHSLAQAFKALQTAYTCWREKLRDPRRRWLGWLSGVFGDILSRERLQQMRGWWIYRSRNTAWAALNAKGVDNQDAEAEQRPSLRQLRRYYRNSLLVRYALVAWPWVVTGVAAGALALVLEYGQRVDTSKLEVAALTPYRIADAVLKQIASQEETDEQEAKALVFESAMALDMLRNIQKPKTGLLERYREWRQPEAPSVFYLASVQVNNAVRSTLGTTMWPVPSPASRKTAATERDRSAQNMKSLPPACERETKKSLRTQIGDDSIDVSGVRHTPAPGEPDGGRRLLMVRSPETSLNFFLLGPAADCTARSLSNLTVPPNSDVETDTDLRLVVVNTESKTFLYRIDWIRRCQGNEGSAPCNVDFYPVYTLTIHPNGPYHVEDSSHVRHGGQLYQLSRDHTTTLLTGEENVHAQEAFAAASDGGLSSDKKLICDRRGPYVAVLAAQKERGPIDIVRILSVKGDRPCQEYVGDKTVILGFDLRNYTIRNVAFANEASSTPDGVPDHIYLQSEEEGVIYKLAWKPALLRSMLCVALRKQNRERVPSAAELTTSVEVQEALNKKDEFAPAGICN